jgi:hypothetical protein
LNLILDGATSLACDIHATFDPYCAGCRGRSRAVKPSQPLGFRGLALAALAALGIGILVGLVSNWIDSLRYVAVAALALALIGWAIYWANILLGARGRERASGRPISGSAPLTGAVLASALGLASVGDVTAGLVLIAVLALLLRTRSRRRRRSRAGLAGPGRPGS